MRNSTAQQRTKEIIVMFAGLSIILPTLMYSNHKLSSDGLFGVKFSERIELRAKDAQAKGQPEQDAQPEAPTVSPTPTMEVTPTVGDSPNKERIENKVKARFAEHYEKAKKVLDCENFSRNPKAVNTAGNTPKGSRDIGVFQINEYWQDVNAKFLFDEDTNIAIAWQIFKDNGYSFERWTCGRKLGV